LLRYVPIAVLAALVAPAAMAPQHQLRWGGHVWSVAFGAWVAWRTRNVAWTIVGGMAAYWLLRFLGL
jgi:branched-subunit amino acid transport protein